MLKPKITAHGLADCLDRLGNFLEHYKARSFGADALALGSFVTHFDRWASRPRGVETNADVARRVAATVSKALDEIGHEDGSVKKLPKPAEPRKLLETEDPTSEWYIEPRKD